MVIADRLKAFECKSRTWQHCITSGCALYRAKFALPGCLNFFESYSRKFLSLSFANVCQRKRLFNKKLDLIAVYRMSVKLCHQNPFNSQSKENSV